MKERSPRPFMRSTRLVDVGRPSGQTELMGELPEQVASVDDVAGALGGEFRAAGWVARLAPWRAVMTSARSPP